MSTITPDYRTIKDLLQSQSFAIDEYQREYKWDRDNIVELLTDLRGKFESCYQAGDLTTKVSTYDDYFLGSIIVSKRSGKNYLIDGQQRITSLTLLLIYLYRIAAAQRLPVSDTLSPLIYSDNYGEPRFNLDIPERLGVIRALFNGEAFNPDGHDESVQTMYARYQDIEAEDLAGELGPALLHFIYWLMNNVGLIEIATDNDSYAYAIFETMNDRGKPLSPVDMLKAYLLAPIEDPRQRRAANDTWKQQTLSLISWGGEHQAERDAACIKAWLRAQYAESIRDRKAGAKDKDWELIGSAFHRWVRDNRVRLELGNPAENMAMVTSAFPFFAKAYQLILDASRTYIPAFKAVFYNAYNEFTWQNTVLLAPLSVTDDMDTVQRKVAATATYLDIWIMRRVTNYIRVSYASTSYAMYLLSRDIRNKSLPELVELLIKKLNQDEVTFGGAASKGTSGIDGWHLNQFSRRYIVYLLARLTAFTEAGAGQPDRFAEYVDRTMKNPYDIEHIWADDFGPYADQFASQQEFQDLRNHVAGLVLLPADVNRSLQAKPFSAKAPHYAKQNLYAASLTDSTYQHQPQFTQFRQRTGLPFKPYTTFGRAQQEERRALVHAMVQWIWAPDRIQDAVR